MGHTNGTVAPSASSALGRLVEDLTARLQAGEAVDWDAAAREHPEHAAELSALRPALELLGCLSRSGNSAVSGLVAVASGDMLPGVLGDFQIIREVGRGGMGVVYEALQISLNRRVALKVLPLAATMDPRQLARFRHEAQAAAMLHHGHIVPVYGVGCERGVHFFAMQLIEGQSLAAMIDAMRLASRERERPESGPTPVAHAPGSPTAPVAAFTTRKTGTDKAHYRRVAELVAQAADALEYAHSMGVVHRDVKPANLILDDGGHLWVTDFGLARLGDGANLTISGDLLGTLRYMSPEQALAKHGLVDHRTDVYSLGATLYELLTLRPAVSGTDRREILRRIAFEEPAPLRSHDRTIPAELETVVLKALAKEPAERYASAGEFANDLRCWLDDRPIRARPVTLRQRAAKCVVRHAVLVRAAVAVLLVLATAAIGGLVALARAWDFAEQRRVAAEEISGRMRLRLYVADMRRAHDLFHHGGPKDLLDLAQLVSSYQPRPSVPDLRGFEWFYLKTIADTRPSLIHTFPSDRGDVFVALFSPDGRFILTAGEQGVIDWWDARTFERIDRQRGHTDEVNSVAFSPDGRLLASCSDDRTIRLWDVPTRRHLGTLNRHMAYVSRIAFSPDGRLLASAGWDKTVYLWDVVSQTFVAEFPGHLGRVYGVAFSPDGRVLASCGITERGDDDIRIWDVATRSPRGIVAQSPETVHCAFSPDGTILAGIDYGGGVRLYRDCRLLRSLGHHKPIGRFVRFTPDGNHLITCGDDRQVAFWSVQAGGEVGRFTAHDQLPAHPRRTWAVALSPDGRSLVTAGADQSARLWELPRCWPCRHYCLPPVVMPIAIGADTPIVAFAETSGRIQVWALSQGVSPIVGPSPWGTHMGSSPWAFSPDERLLAFIGGDLGEPDRPLVWDSDRGMAIAHVRPTPTVGAPREVNKAWLVEAAAFARGGRTVLTIYSDGLVHETDLDTGSTHSQHGLLRPNVTHCIAVAAAGTVIISAGQDWRVWDVERRQWTGSGGRLLHDISGLSLSADGQLLAACDQDRTIHLIDVETGRERQTILRNRRVLDGSGMAFSPDGRTLAVVGDEVGVQLLNVATGEVLFTLGDAPMGDAAAVRFRSDGQALVAVSGWRRAEGRVTVWEVPRSD